MQKTYWTLFWLGICGIALCAFLLIIVILMAKSKSIAKGYCAFYTVALVFGLALCVYILIPCIKDYSLVVSDNYFEENAVVVEFTHVSGDELGNPNYSQPKFYIASKDEYIILYVVNVEVGKEYRIRYYPNTKICEVLYVIENGDSGDGVVRPTEN